MISFPFLLGPRQAKRWWGTCWTDKRGNVLGDTLKGRIIFNTTPRIKRGCFMTADEERIISELTQGINTLSFAESLQDIKQFNV